MRDVFVVTGYGVFVGLDGDTVVVREKGIVIDQKPFREINTLAIVGSHIAVSSALVRACVLKAIPIIFFDSLNRVVAQVISPRMRKFQTHAEQQRRYASSVPATKFVCRFLAEKFRRQHQVIHYHARSLRLSEKPIHDIHFGLDALARMAYIEKSPDEARNDLFLTEARVAHSYWMNIQRLVSNELNFPGRVHRHAGDPFNQLLNYGYAMLSSIVLRQTILAGLDPTVGLLHHRQVADYPLVYDLMEPFRPLVDHGVLAFVHRQRDSLQDHTNHLRPAVLRRFRRHWVDFARCPEPWSSRRLTLEEMVRMTVERLVSRVTAA